MNELDKHYNELLNISGKIVTYFSLIPILIGLFYYKTFNKPIKLFFYLLIFELGLNILAELFIWSVNIESHYKSFWKPILTFTKIEDTNFFNGFSYFASFLFVGWFYYLIMQKASFSLWLKWICFGLCVFEVINYIFIDGFRSKGAIGLVSSNFYVVVMAGLYLWYLSNNPPDLPILKNSYFLISITLLVTSLISFIYSFTAETIYETDFVFYCKIKIFRNCINMLSQIVILAAFIRSKYLKYL